MLRRSNGTLTSGAMTFSRGNEVLLRSCPARRRLSPSPFKNRRMMSAHIYFPKSNNIIHACFCTRGNEPLESIMRREHACLWCEHELHRKQVLLSGETASNTHDVLFLLRVKTQDCRKERPAASETDQRTDTEASV